MTTSEFKCTGGVWLTQLVRVQVGSRGQISNSKADLCNACDIERRILTRMLYPTPHHHPNIHPTSAPITHLRPQAAPSHTKAVNYGRPFNHLLTNACHSCQSGMWL